MSRFNPQRNVGPVLDAAAEWIKRCLINEGSLFTDRSLWTTPVLNEVRAAFVDNPDDSDASFFDKLEVQLSAASPDARCLMAELLWVLMLFQSNIGPPKKRESIERVWSWSGSALDMSHLLLNDAVLTGVGSPGTAYNTMRWRELGYLIGLSLDLVARPREERIAILSNRDRFEQWLSAAPQVGYRQFRHIFRYLAFPDFNERITQNRDRRQILEANTDTDPRTIRAMSDAQQDDALRALRKRLATKLGTKDLDFYASPLVEGWREPKQQAASTHATAGVAESAAPMKSPSSPAVARPVAPLNQILFGPPGTGKTYQAIEKALEILDPLFLRGLGDDKGDGERRRLLKERYDVLSKEGLVQFVTFHQSFSYENFVEGLSATTDPDTKQIQYEVADGVFKELCESARTRLVRRSEDAPLELAGRRIWKLSLGDYSTEGQIYDDCIDQGLALVGFGNNADFSRCQSREDIQRVFASSGEHLSLGDYPITAINTFVRLMKKGDLVVVTEGNLKFRAIGEIAGDYKLVPRDADSYSQARAIRWLRVYQPALPHGALMEKRFQQKTTYELHPGSINHDKLRALLKAEDGPAGADHPRVLIIDEINRGNVSRIFGELITLIERSKRADAPEALKATLTYSKEEFSVPGNVYLIGTMNTADRSLAGLDIALRRRFEFVEMAPDPSKLAGIKVAGVDLSTMLELMNRRIEVLLDRDHQIGHACFMSLTNDAPLSELASIFRHQIVPLLQEYFFEDWQRIAWVLNDHRKDKGFQFVAPSAFSAESLFGHGVDVPANAKLWRLDEQAFDRPESYIGILGDGKV